MGKKSCCNGIGIIVIILLIAGLVINGLYIFGKSPAEKLEALKVGGAENFEMVKKLWNNDSFKQQQKEAIENALEQMGDTAVDLNEWNEIAENTDTSVAELNLADDSLMAKVDEIKEDGYINGNEDARFILLEYSDFECPFCKRHFQSNTIKDLMTEYDGEVAHIYRHFPLSFHEYAQKAAEAAECAGEIGWAEKFYAFEAEAFNAEDLSITNLKTIAKKIGVDEAKFTTCVDSDKYLEKTQAQMQEGSSIFGVTGTPGNVIVDTENGTYEVISGAYPLDKFVETIENMKK